MGPWRVRFVDKAIIAPYGSAHEPDGLRAAAQALGYIPWPVARIGNDSPRPEHHPVRAVFAVCPVCFRPCSLLVELPAGLAGGGPGGIPGAYRWNFDLDQPTLYPSVISGACTMHVNVVGGRIVPVSGRAIGGCPA